TALETGCLLTRLAGNGRRQLPWARTDFDAFRLPCNRMASFHRDTCVRCDSPVCCCAINPAATRISHRMDGDDRNRADPPLWSFPIALLLLAKPWHRSAAYYEPSPGVNKLERVLGAALEHGLP